MSQKTVVCAVPVDPAKRLGFHYNGPEPGYSQHPCSGCGEPLWVGPKIRAVAATGEEVWCPSCMIQTFGLENLDPNVTRLP